MHFITSGTTGAGPPPYMTFYPEQPLAPRLPKDYSSYNFR